MAQTESQKKSQKKYRAEKAKQVNLQFPIKEYNLLLNYAEKYNSTPTQIIRDRIADIIHPNENS